jgi:hypothetical protein
MGWNQSFINENVVCSMGMLNLIFKTDIPTSEILLPILNSLEVKITVTVMTSIETQNPLQYFHPKHGDHGC